MKYIYVILVLSLFVTGCGYKADPVYIDDTKDIQMEKL